MGALVATVMFTPRSHGLVHLLATPTTRPAQ